MPKRVLVTGRGSIAQRHVRHLRELVPDVDLGVVASVELGSVFQPCRRFDSFESALTWLPEAVIIASISSRHGTELESCLALGLPCLVEKPLVTSRTELNRVRALLEGAPFTALVVGCNLRHLPALKKFRAELAGKLGRRILRAQFEVGQELTQWRPGRSLADSYSAIASQGGGVVFDLVHEIDMALWLLGPLHVVAAVAGQFSELPINSDDVHVALLRTNDGVPVVISLDYVSQQVVRRYSIVTEIGTYEIDIPRKHIILRKRDGNHIVNDCAEDFDVACSYRLQMADWLALIADSAHHVATPIGDALETAGLMLDLKEAVS
ncbi:Gfo/Idh/MocA family protein [Polaromonas aquatica]|uniref:Gfo/Idh/MocA family protein n=1 Tax=Polaromonas aquatica TaxID=332657 RepID=UPI003D656A60